MNTANTPPRRDTLSVEDARVIAHDSWEGEQFIVRVHAPRCAARARPGSFVHLSVEPANSPIPQLRRPISIMQVSAESGWVDLLYKAVGTGTHLLSHKKVGDTISLIGPIGEPFRLSSRRPRPLLIGGGVGMPPMIFLADEIRQHHADFAPFVILGSEVPFPFHSQHSTQALPGVADDIDASMPLLNDWGIPSRLASQQGYPGCFQGFVTGLARAWLNGLDTGQRDQVEIFSCGPHPMLQSVAHLAREFDLPCQVSLEEFMACGIGGCAGCTVEVLTDNGPSMQRVCVDGPVFNARQVFP